ncbi:MAG: bifunctional riboflavin kinase/FAD synthetase [Clostridia bacterium]|nr:bifunctional riboflavin kinase/FAD synthetase [Clostridia bacterium]
MTDFKDKKTAVALGTFDGLHKGHMSVINKAVIQKDYGLLPVILLFSEHPRTALTGKPKKTLFCGEVKDRIIRNTGCVPYTIDFNRIKNMSAEEFVKEILVKELNAKAVCCGFNYRFAKDASGDSDTLKQLCNKYGISVTVSDEVVFEGESINSTRIRKAIENGDIRKANEMLGRHFSYSFEVVDGDHRGRTLGFPTINQFFCEDLTVPEFGVYASAAFVEGKWYPAVTNIGIRPTVGNSTPRSETSIIGWEGNLYGTFTEVALIEYLREEIKFPDFDALKEQIKKDSELATEIFERENLR